MGVEQSKEEAAATIRGMDATIDEYAAEYLAKQKALKDEQAARLNEQNTHHINQPKDVAVPKKKRELVRSSKSEAAPRRTSRQPFTVESDDDDDDEESEPADVLAAFQPRNEQATLDDEQLRSGKVAASAVDSAIYSVKSTPKASVDSLQGAPGKVKPGGSAISASGRGSQAFGQTKPSIPATVKAAVATAGSSKFASAGPSTGCTSAKQATAVPKRPAPPSAFANERRTSAHKQPKRSSAASPQSPDGISEASAPAQRADNNERPPKWYNSLKPASNRKPEENSADTLMKALKTEIKKCKDTIPPPQRVFDRIEKALQTLPFTHVSEQLLRNNRMLHNDDGLPQLFDKQYTGGVAFPWYLQADAEELYNKWCRRDFGTDLLRGIISGRPGTKKNEKATDKLDPKYEQQSSKYAGNGMLLNGQWWPTQLATVRDRAHGASIAGISGEEGKGAYSCVMSGGLDSSNREYPDKDDGDVVLYCGTDSTDGSTTAPTRRMLESEQSGQPVRLIRSHNLKTPYAPVKGFRYDGLYKVVSSENLDAANSLRQRHQFKLERLAGQPKIRGGDGPEARPSIPEIDAHQKDKHLRGY